MKAALKDPQFEIDQPDNPETPEKHPASHITGLSQRERDIYDTFDALCAPENTGICAMDEDSRFRTICGVPGKNVPRYSPEVLIREALPKNFPLLSAIDGLIESLLSLKTEFENCQKNIAALEAELEKEAPLSNRASELSRKYQEEQRQTFGFIKKRITLKQFNAQRSIDKADHVNSLRTRIKEEKRYLNRVALKITLHEARIKEIIDEYLTELSLLSPENQEIIKQTPSHIQIMFILEDLD